MPSVVDDRDPVYRDAWVVKTRRLSGDIHNSYKRWWFYSNGGTPHRPAWEDVILDLIDRERGKVEKPIDDKWRRLRAQQEERNRERATEADTLRSVSTDAHRRQVKEARKLAARHRNKPRRSDIRVWRAPRGPEDNPEGLEEGKA